MGTQILTRLMNYFELFATKHEYIKKKILKKLPPNQMKIQKVTSISN